MNYVTIMNDELKKRAFLVSYKFGSGYGDACVISSNGSFPASKEIRDGLLPDEVSGEHGLIITNIFEFKTMSDYKDFSKEYE